MMATLHEPTIEQDTVPAGVRLVAFGLSGPDVLALAADLPPEASEPGSVLLSGDVYAALVEALCRLGRGVDLYHGLRLADEALDMLAAYLVSSGRARRGPRVSATVRGWVIFQDFAAAQVVLAAAAGFWRAELSPRMSDAGWGW